MAVLTNAVFMASGRAQDNPTPPAASPPAQAPFPIPADTGDSTLHILRPIIHADQDDAEFCLEFDHALAGANYNRIAASSRLEVNGKNRPLTARNISVADNVLCFAPLEHRRDYHFTLTNIRGAKDEKLPEAYSLSFTIPDRPPALNFIADSDSGGMIRWPDTDPVLHIINVPRAKIELYRITDTARQLDAWRQRLQTTLAPTESAYFARHYGQLIWQGDVDLPAKPNKIVSLPLSLRADVGDVPPGIYLVIASAPEADAKTLAVASVPDTDPSAKPKTINDKTKTERLAPLTAAWLLHSAVQVDAHPSEGTIYATTETADGANIADGVTLSLYDKDNRPIAESVSDNHGLAQLHSAKDKNLEGAVIVAADKAGNLGFTDVTLGDKVFAAPSPPAILTLDRPYYQPDDLVKIGVAAFDAKGNAATNAGSQICLQRPDGSTFLTLPVPDSKTVSFNAPAQNGIWSVLWQRPDGVTLATANLRVTSNSAAPVFHITADRTLLTDDNAVTLTLNSLGAAGQPLPYLAGQLTGVWTVPQHPFAAWPDYYFGSDAAAARAAALKPGLSVAFITDDKGQAVLREPVVPLDSPFMQTLDLRIEGGPGSGAAQAAPFSLSVAPHDPVIGIKPLHEAARFPENSLARFAVIALGGDGKRREAHDLSYQLFEEGRSFDWYQAEGRWAFKQRAQQSSLGGGQLDIAADHDTLIEWPVTAGSYRLDIVDDDGRTVASVRFSAGWSASESRDTDIKKLALTAEPPMLVLNQPTKLGFRLDRPSVVTVMIADDHIRQVIHQPMPAGANTISFTPQSDWGHNLALWVDAPAVNAKDVLRLATAVHDTAIRDPAASKTDTPNPSPDITTEPPAAINLGSIGITAAVPTEIRTGDKVMVTLNLADISAKTHEATAPVHYAFTATGGIKLADSNDKPDGTLNPGQTRNLSLALSAVQVGRGELRLDVTGSHGLHASHAWQVANQSRDSVLDVTDRTTLPPKQIWSPRPAGTPISTHSDNDSATILFVGGHTLQNLPETLSVFANVNPFSSHEIAHSLIVLQHLQPLLGQASIGSDKIWLERQHDLLLRLLQRQKGDGSFADFADRDGDIDTTAAALTALASVTDPIAHPAALDAGNWLNNRLGNSWFDEKDRPAHAAAYAAMAMADRLDIASLYYFADTSLDKKLPPRAAAQLALAFAKMKDRAKVTEWANRAKPELDYANFSPETLVDLITNPLLNADDFAPALQKLSDRIAADPATSIDTIANYLLAATDAQRNVAWHFELNGEAHTGNGVTAFRIDPAQKVLLHNLGDQPLFAAVTHEIPARHTLPGDKDNNGVSRHVYRMNGTLLSDRQAFDRDTVYAVVLEGAWPKGRTRPLFVHDDVNPLVTPITCALSPDFVTGDALNWLSKLTPTTPQSCELSPRAVDVAVAPDGDAAVWRVIYLARAKASGLLRFSPPIAH